MHDDHALNGLTDQHIREVRLLPTPYEVKAALPMTARARATVKMGRDLGEAILRGEDRRRIICAGPCSVHDTNAVREKARALAELQEDVRDTHVIFMRTYFEKSRTGLGWRGYVNDPHITGRLDPAYGRFEARKLLLDIAEMGLPVVTEVLHPNHIQFYDNLVSLATVGARSVEYPELRYMMSGLSMPVGMKHRTNGNIDEAIAAMATAYEDGSFLGLTGDGREGDFETKGNPLCFLVMRGGEEPNYDAGSVADALAKIDSANAQRPEGEKFIDRVIIDCSHGNCKGPDGKKNYLLQPQIALDIGQQMVTNPRIAGLMIESYLKAGSKSLPLNLKGFERSTLAPDISVTDGCIDLNTLQKTVRELHYIAKQGPAYSGVMR